ncbi:MAG: sigma-70 family RNA polymerase sigma factor, partial [Anaeroplasmataceae bacterium]|nr:sigma-70 family RNA polymerase sigma factor [Anaeroplasmataceae bacterium]
SLPEPLKEEDEKKYVEAMLEGDLEARNILIERNMRLVVFIAKRFESPKVLLEDLISIGSMGLIKGVETFKLDKNIKLATYASRCIENEILMFLRKVSKQKNEVSLDEALNVDGDGNELLLADVIPTNQMLAIDEAISNEKERIMYEAVEKLNAREKEIITLRFGLYRNEELTQKEVADKLGISQSYISRLEKKIIDKLKCEMEKKLTIVSK